MMMRTNKEAERLEKVLAKRFENDERVCNVEVDTGTLNPCITFGEDSEEYLASFHYEGTETFEEIVELAVAAIKKELGRE